MMQDGYFTTQDGRIVKFLDNPLPVPKKHVKKEMDFKFHDVEPLEKKADDFDYPIRENDDFDIE